MFGPDEPMSRLLDYDGRRYWLENGWSIRFRISLSPVSVGRPFGVKYAMTLHDADGTRLLGFDNAHGIGRHLAYDHRHRFRRTMEVVPYDFRGADELLCDFFDAIERACRQEGIAFAFESAEVDVVMEQDDGTDEPG